METKNNIGVWMDHSIAILIKENTDIDGYSILSKFDFQTKEEALNKSEKLMHNKEMHMQDAFYKKIALALKDYDNVLLFGPTDAKKELFNILKKDAHYADVNIEIESPDKLTINERNAFVRNHYKNKILY
jgi:hypothetical protein